MASQFESLLDETEETLEKYKNRANELRKEHDERRAATKVQIKAMVERLEEKYENMSAELEEIRDAGSDRADDLKRLNRQVVNDLKDMGKTIRRRIR